MPSSVAVIRTLGTWRLCVVCAFTILASTAYFSLDRQAMQSFLLMVKRDPSGSLHIFIAAYTLSVVLLFPCMIMQVISGALYGFAKGFMVSWVSTSAGQALAFLLGRYLFRPTVKGYLHSTWPSFPTIDHAIKRDGWKLVCLLRLSPVLPYNVLNYALSITPVPFWIFTVGSAVATLPWTALYVYVGTFTTNTANLALGKVEYKGNMHTLIRVLSGVAIALTSIYGYTQSQHAINAVLRKTSEQVGNNSGSSSSGSFGGTLDCSGSPSKYSPLPPARSLSLSMGAREQQDLERGKQAGLRPQAGPFT